MRDFSHKRVCVYASSSERTPQKYLDQAAELGRLLAELGVILVNGAGRTGCMGALNDACLAAGGRVEGVILRKFLDEDLGHQHLQELIVADTMRERKRLLAKDIEIFVALPGGPGTWEELWEIAVERQIGTHQSPLIIVNTDAFYAGFHQQLIRAEEEGLLYGPAADLMDFTDNAVDAVAKITGYLA